MTPGSGGGRHRSAEESADDVLDRYGLLDPAPRVPVPSPPAAARQTDQRPRPRRQPGAPPPRRDDTVRRHIDEALTQVAAGPTAGTHQDRDTLQDDAVQDRDTLHDSATLHDGDTLHDGGIDGRADDSVEADPPHRLGLSVLRWLTVATALLVFATTAVGWSTKAWLELSIREVAALDPESDEIVDAAAQAGDANILVIGSTAGRGLDGTRTATATIAVAHVPADRSRVVAVLFPPDLEVGRPPCLRWDPGSGGYLDETVPAQTRTRLADAFRVGGPRCVTQVVQQLSGLSITRFVGWDLDGVREMVDAVDGVPVCVPRPVVDRVLGTTVADAGTSILDGGRALDFVRAGDVAGEPVGGAVQRQQQVLAALLDDVLSAGTLLDLGRLRAFAAAFGPATLADGTGVDELFALAASLRDLGADGVQPAPVPTAGTTRLGNTVLRKADAAALFDALRVGAPLPEVSGEPDGSVRRLMTSEVVLDVLNAAGRSGLAAAVGDTLEELGFGIGEVGNAEPGGETVIRFSPDRVAAAELLAASVPSATTVPDPGTSGVLQLVLGRSFDGTLRVPAQDVALGAPEASC